MSHDPVSLSLIERVERALVLLAVFIEMDGEVHVPMYERFEAELEQLRRKEDTKDRARRRLGLARMPRLLDASCSKAPLMLYSVGEMESIPVWTDHNASVPSKS